MFVSITSNAVLQPLSVSKLMSVQSAQRLFTTMPHACSVPSSLAERNVRRRSIGGTRGHLSKKSSKRFTENIRSWSAHRTCDLSSESGMPCLSRCCFMDILNLKTCGESRSLTVSRKSMYSLRLSICFFGSLMSLKLSLSNASYFLTASLHAFFVVCRYLSVCFMTSMVSSMAVLAMSLAAPISTWNNDDRCLNMSLFFWEVSASLMYLSFLTVAIPICRMLLVRILATCRCRTPPKCHPWSPSICQWLLTGRYGRRVFRVRLSQCSGRMVG